MKKGKMMKKKGKECIICGKGMKLYSKANYNLKQLDSYGFASRKIPEYMHYELQECNKCRLLSAVNTLDLSELSEKYKEADFDSSSEADNASRTYMYYLKKHYPNFPRKSVMDIGTGEGSFLKYLYEEKAEKIVGVEPSVAPIKKADARIRDCIVNDVFRAEDYKKEEQDFDLISCFQTIEHIPNPEQQLRGIYDILKKGGIVYIVCHNYRSFVNRLLGMKSPIYDIEHLQLFSKKSIVRLLKKSGYQDIKVFTLRNKYPLKYWVRLFPLPERVKKIIMCKAEKSSWGKLEIGINVGNVGVIARKK